MKFCLSSRNEQRYLLKADEIKVQYRDRKEIPDLFEKYPQATIILEIYYYGEDIDWDSIKLWYNLSKRKFIIALANITDMDKAKEIGIPFYYGFPIKTFYELNALKSAGVAYVRLGEPLFFQMDQVKKIGIPVRAVPNVAYNDGFLRQDGVCGLWIRPEDIELYEPYISVMEFEDCDPQKERALYRIYAEKQEWPGDLKMIISNFNHEGVNRMIHRDLTIRRLNCGQRCQEGYQCRFCKRSMLLANPDRIEKHAEATGRL